MATSSTDPFGDSEFDGFPPISRSSTPASRGGRKLSITSMGDPVVDKNALRKKRWVEVRFFYYAIRDAGFKPIVMLDVFDSIGAIPRPFFVSVLIRALAALDPFEIDPRLTTLFNSFDLERTGGVDPKRIQCCFRLLEKPHDSSVDLIRWACICFSKIHGNPIGGGAKLTVSQEQLRFLLQLPCMLDDDVEGIMIMARPLLARFGHLRDIPMEPLLKYLESAECEPLMKEHRLHALQRMPESVRMAVLRAILDNGARAVAFQENVLLDAKASKFFNAIGKPRRRKYYFHVWCAFTERKKIKWKGFMAADKYYRLIAMRKYIRWWARWARVPRLNETAERIAEPRIKEWIFARWKKWHEINVQLYGMAKKHKHQRFLAKCEAAEKWRARREAQWRRTWLAFGFNGIRIAWQRSINVRRAGLLLRKNLCRRYFYLLYRYRCYRKMKRQREEESKRLLAAVQLEKKKAEAYAAAVEARRKERTEEREKKAEARLKREAADRTIHARIRFAANNAAKRVTSRLATERGRAAAQWRSNLKESERLARRRFRKRKSRGFLKFLRTNPVGQAKVKKQTDFVLEQVEEEELPDESVINYLKSIRAPWRLLYNYKLSGRYWKEVNHLSPEDNERVQLDMLPGRIAGPRVNKKGPALEPAITAKLAQEIAERNLIQAAMMDCKDEMDDMVKRLWDEAIHRKQARRIAMWYKSLRSLLKFQAAGSAILTQVRAKAARSQIWVRTNSAKTIQRAWRSRVSRTRMYNLLFSVWEAKVDYESGSTYYINTVTGESRWELPKLMERLHPKVQTKKTAAEAVEEDIGKWLNGWQDIDKVGDDGGLVSARYEEKRQEKAMEARWEARVTPGAGANIYISTTTGEVRGAHEKPEGYIVCEICKFEFATLMCTDCGFKAYCPGCFMANHRKRSEVRHSGVPVITGRQACYVCSSLATEYCKSSPCNGIAYCSRCSRDSHEGKGCVDHLRVEV